MPTPIQARVQLERVALADLKPAPYNPRAIGEREKEGLRASLETFGVVEPIIVNRRSGHVVGGHQRLAILREEGVLETDVVYVDLTPAKEKALNVALNNPKTSGRFTDEVRAILADLEAEHADLSSRLLLRDLEQDLGKLLGDQAEPVRDPSVPTPPKRPTAQVGDLWHLGRHRLICGDSTDPATADRLLEGALADLVHTDPPYGVSYEAPSGKHEVIEGDRKTRDELLGLLVPALKSAVAHSRPTAAFYVWHASSTRAEFDYALKAAGLEERQYLIWVKPAPVLGHADYLWSHEPCYYASKAGHKPAWYGHRDQPTVWRIARGDIEFAATVLGPGLLVTDGHGDQIYLTPKAPKGKRVRALRLEIDQPLQVVTDDSRSSAWEVAKDSGPYRHPTQKPAALAARAISNSTKLGDRVLDLFGGAGSTLLAAETLGRTAYLAELDPAFCEVIVARWEELTGLKAERVPRGTPPAPKAARPPAKARKR